MSRGPDAGTLLRRALERSARDAGCTLAVVGTTATRWASATFAGAQHRMTFDASDDAALAAWLAALPEVELPISGHLVADVMAAIVARHTRGATVTLEALTVEI